VSQLLAVWAFFCSRLKKFSIAALSPAEPAQPIDTTHGVAAVPAKVSVLLKPPPITTSPP
jgi:hypothetical protein